MAKLRLRNGAEEIVRYRKDVPASILPETVIDGTLCPALVLPARTKYYMYRSDGVALQKVGKTWSTNNRIMNRGGKPNQKLTLEEFEGFMKKWNYTRV
jgi:hypothetical protein